MSERISKDLDKLRREIENLEGQATNFKESLENLLELQNYYQTMASLIQSKFITLNESLRGLIEENKNSLDNYTKEGSTKNIEQINQWTETQISSTTSKLEETKSMLSALQTNVLETMEKGKQEFVNYSSSLEEKITSILNSHEQDLERLSNNQVNAFRKAITSAKEGVNEIRGSSIGTFEKNAVEIKNQLEANINITENIMKESIEHLRAEYGDRLTENMESIFESFNRIKSELGQLVENAVKRIQSELSGISGTMDKYLIDEIAKIQEVLAEYEKGMIDVNEVALTNFNESKAAMLSTYDKLLKTQIDSHGDELKAFQDNFNQNIDDELGSFSKQSDEMKEETKTIVSSEKDELKKELTAIQTLVSDAISKTKNQNETDISEKLTLLEKEIESIKLSIEKTSTQIKTQVESLEKDSLASISSKASSMKGQIADTQQTVMSDLDVEAKEHIRKAEDAEKMKRDLVSRIERLERSIESIKNEL